MRQLTEPFQDNDLITLTPAGAIVAVLFEAKELEDDAIHELASMAETPDMSELVIQLQAAAAMRQDAINQLIGLLILNG